VYCAAINGEEHPMMADTVPAKNGVRGQWDFYICSYKKNSRGKKCTASRISAAGLDKAVIDKLMTEVLTRDNLKPIAEKLAEGMLESSSN
jgi:hypothetical protein